MEKQDFCQFWKKNALIFETKDKAFTFGMALLSFNENSAVGVDVKHSFNVTRIDSYLSSPNTHVIVNCTVSDDQMSYRSYPLLVARELLQKFIREQVHGHQAA